MTLKLKELGKTYQDSDRTLTIIDNLTYTFERGSYAIVGRSGVGKSTLLHLLGGLDRPTSGQIFLDDINLSVLSNDALSHLRGDKIGFIFQFHHLLPEFSAEENVAMPLVISGMREAEALIQAREVLDRVGLGSRAKHRPGELSGGEQQRVAISRAIISKPSLVLADEPTGNLDVATAQAAQELLLEINRELNSTLIIVTHSLELARSMGITLEMGPGGNLKDLR